MYNKLLLPIVFAVMGYIFSTKSWLLFLDKLNPISGLLVYYMIMTLAILILEYFGLIIGGIKFDSFSHTIGTILIIFSFFLIICFESLYVSIVTNKNIDNVSNVYLQSEDGATWYSWSLLFTDISTLRLLTYVLTPFLLTLIGQFLISSKITISPF